MENFTTIQVHNGVKDAFRGIPKKHQGYYRSLWHEIVFNSDDQEDYAALFLEEVNEEAGAGRLSEKALRKLIARWYEDLLDHRAVALEHFTQQRSPPATAARRLHVESNSKPHMVIPDP